MLFRVAFSVRLKPLFRHGAIFFFFFYIHIRMRVSFLGDVSLFFPKKSFFPPAPFADIALLVKKPSLLFLPAQSPPLSPFSNSRFLPVPSPPPRLSLFETNFSSQLGRASSCLFSARPSNLGEGRHSLFFKSGAFPFPFFTSKLFPTFFQAFQRKSFPPFPQRILFDIPLPEEKKDGPSFCAR